jgi:hypothetical protein
MGLIDASPIVTLLVKSSQKFALIGRIIGNPVLNCNEKAYKME